METDLQRARVLIELDPAREPISGRVTDGRGQHRTFSGWLELMDILDRAREGVRPINDVRTGSGDYPAREEATE